MKNRPFIKICGITQEIDLVTACESGADAVGFIAYPKSPRYVSPSEVKSLLNHYHADNKLKVAVFVNAALDEINQYIKAGIDVIQLHGDETEEYAASIDKEIWKAVRLHDEYQIDEFENYPCSKFLIDSFVKDSVIPGGTGHVANWSLAAKFVERVNKDVLLAGGINAGNAEEALNRVKPFGIDLSSGVEKSPGIKDPAKIREFFSRVDSLFAF